MKNLATQNGNNETADIQDVIQKALENCLLKIAANSDDEILDIKGAAVLIKEAPKTIYKKVAQRKIPHIKEGSRLRFLRGDLLNWLKSYRVKTVDELSVESEAIMLLSTRRRE